MKEITSMLWGKLEQHMETATSNIIYAEKIRPWNATEVCTIGLGDKREGTRAATCITS